MCLAVRNARWESVATLFGLEQFVDGDWRNASTRVARWAEIKPAFDESVASRTRSAWFAEAAERGLIVGPVQDLHEVLRSEHYAARSFFTTIDRGGQTVACPGLPFKWDCARGEPSGIRNDSF
jgi:crotonobetainyl-CoA:carnitine CoA-transferase CaiB-like acyl-CoA transferase